MDYKFVPLVFTPTELRVFPAQVDTSDVVSLNFDQSLATSTNEQRMTPDSVTVLQLMIMKHAFYQFK